MPDTELVDNPIKLPPRRAAQLKRVLHGEPIGQASAAVGYSSASTGSRALQDTRKRLLLAMERYSLTPDSFVRDYLLPLLNATQTQRASFMGKFTDEAIDADNGVRLAAVRETGKLMGLYPKEDSAGGLAVSININNMGNVE